MIKPDLLKERGDHECDINDEEVGSDVLSENDSPTLSDSNSNLDISEMEDWFIDCMICCSFYYVPILWILNNY